MCVFLCFFREFSHANVLFCVCFHACMTDFTFTLRLFTFPKKYRKWGFKRPKPMFIGWIWDNLNQSGHGGGSKCQQLFLFGSEEWNALVSSDESLGAFDLKQCWAEWSPYDIKVPWERFECIGSDCFLISLTVLWCHTVIILRSAASSRMHLMLSKCDDVITYTTEPPNIQKRQMRYFRKAENLHFTTLLKHSDRISGSAVIKHLRTIVIFSCGRLSRSLRVKIFLMKSEGSLTRVGYRTRYF